jgi:hypothetical protein
VIGAWSEERGRAGGRGKVVEKQEDLRKGVGLRGGERGEIGRDRREKERAKRGRGGAEEDRASKAARGRVRGTGERVGKLGGGGPRGPDQKKRFTKEDETPEICVIGCADARVCGHSDLSWQRVWP